MVGEVDNTKVLGIVDNVGNLLNDTSLPVDDRQVQWPRGWGVGLWPSKSNH